MRRHRQEQVERPTSVAEGDCAIVDSRGSVLVYERDAGALQAGLHLDQHTPLEYTCLLRVTRGDRVIAPRSTPPPRSRPMPELDRGGAHGERVF
jgi:hypothetical protein